MSKVAIIGTRSPDQYQLANIKTFIDKLNKSDIIISGCAYGVDEYALRYGKRKGLKTIGCLPWRNYNEDVQELCDELLCYNEQLHELAYDSVVQHHPAYTKLNSTSFRLHARNYLIVCDADVVMAYPGPNGGGTMQGVRIAIANKKDLFVNPHLKE